jgi:aspartyl-tRNA(Asn)/glutamyl-tRNA(Gln) amidotransferase subunit B
LAEHQDILRAYRSGKTKAMQALVGKVMLASKGKASPKRTHEVLEQLLGPPQI